MALQAVEEDPLSNTEENLLSDDMNENSPANMANKENNCYMRDTIMALHR